MLKLFISFLVLNLWFSLIFAQDPKDPTSTPKPRPKIYDIVFGEDTEQECSMRYIKFEGAYLRGVKSPNLISFNASSIWGCQRKCCYETRFVCRSFSYFKPLRQCFIMNLTKADSNAELVHANGYVHVQVMPDFPMTTLATETTVAPEETTIIQIKELTTDSQTEETTAEEATTEPEFWTGTEVADVTATNDPNALNTVSDGGNKSNTVLDNAEKTNTKSNGTDDANTGLGNSNRTLDGSKHRNESDTGINNQKKKNTKPEYPDGATGEGAGSNEVDGSGSGSEKEVDDVNRGAATTTPRTRIGPGLGVFEESKTPEKVISKECPLTCGNEGQCEFRSKSDDDSEEQEAFCKCEEGFGGKKCETAITEEDGFPIWIIIVVVIAGLLLIVIIVGCVLLQVYKKKKGEYKVVEWARIWARRGKKPKKADNPGELAHVEEGPTEGHHNSPTTSVQSIQNSNASTASA